MGRIFLLQFGFINQLISLTEFLILSKQVHNLLFLISRLNYCLTELGVLDNNSENGGLYKIFRLTIVNQNLMNFISFINF